MTDNSSNDAFDLGEMAAALSEASKNYDTVQVDDKSPPPPGNYCGRIESSTLAMTHGDPAKGITRKPKLDLRIRITKSLDAAQIGKAAFKSAVITPESLKYFKEETMACGLEMRPDELIARHKEFEGIHVKFRVYLQKGETNPKFYKVAINGLDTTPSESGAASGSGEDAFATQSEPSGGESDTPF